MVRGAWQATVHGVEKSQTWLKRLSTYAHCLRKLHNWAACTSVTKVSNPVQLLTSWTCFLGFATCKAADCHESGDGQPLAPCSSFWSVSAFSRVGKGPRGRQEDDWDCCELVLFLSGTGGCFKQSFLLTVALRVSLEIPVHISIPHCWSFLASNSLDGSNCISISALSPTASSSTLKKAGS